jgi:hypothetical protein
MSTILPSVLHKRCLCFIPSELSASPGNSETLRIEMRCLRDRRLLLWPPFIRNDMTESPGDETNDCFTLCSPESLTESVSKLGIDPSLVLSRPSSSTIFIQGLMIPSAFALPSNLHCAYCNI